MTTLNTPIDTGGTAFPIVYDSTTAENERVHPIVSSGMSLRDWFAGQALAGLLASMNTPERSDGFVDCAHRMGMGLQQGVATIALQYADAMLAARKAVQS